MTRSLPSTNLRERAAVHQGASVPATAFGGGVIQETCRGTPRAYDVFYRFSVTPRGVSVATLETLRLPSAARTDGPHSMFFNPAISGASGGFCHAYLQVDWLHAVLLGTRVRRPKARKSRFRRFSRRPYQLPDSSDRSTTEQR
ncbi:MAG: hypothetical protein AB8H86_32690 [Polyangiales bacterium]